MRQTRLQSHPMYLWLIVAWQWNKNTVYRDFEMPSSLSRCPQVRSSSLGGQRSTSNLLLVQRNSIFYINKPCSSLILLILFFSIMVDFPRSLLLMSTWNFLVLGYVYPRGGAEIVKSFEWVVMGW